MEDNRELVPTAAGNQGENATPEYFGAEKTAEVCMIWPQSAASQMGKIVEQCRLTDSILASNARISGGAPLATRAGFVAEELHAETFNLDAILKDKDVRAFTDKYRNSPLGTNDPVNDIAIVKNGEQVQGAQLKYYKTGQRTANAFRENGADGNPHYKETDSMVCPADQLEEVRDAARKTELKNQESRPQVAEAARDVQRKATDRLREDGVESRPTTKKEAETIAKGGDDGKGAHRKIQNKYKTASTLQQSAKAAAGAAVVTSVIAGTINTVSCLDKVQKGLMSQGDAVKYILKNTAIAASDSALKAAGATAAVSLTARTLPQLFTGTALQANFATGAVGGAAICAIDLVECLVMVAAGKMTPRELEERTGKNIFQTGAGVVGASIGGTLGTIAGPIGTMVGAMVGGMITSVAATVAIENGIEKPFREIMDNTKSLTEAEAMMSNAVAYLSAATVAMEDFRKGLFLSERDFERGMSVLRQKRAANWNLINNLK